MAEPRGDLHPETVREVNNRVWDMTLNLLHPTFLYVLFQLLILDHLSNAAPLADRSPLEWQSLAIYGLQFLGAWTVLYTTLLRDMGFPCPWGTILLLAALASVAAQYFVVTDPPNQATAAWVLLGTQLGLAVVAWPLTMKRWWFLKRQWLEESEAARRARR